MNTTLEVVYQNGQIQLPPDARIAENTRALLILLEDSKQSEAGAPPVMNAASRTDAWQRLRGIAATDEPPLLDAASQMEIVRQLRGIAKPDGPPPADEEVQEMYTDYLVEKYR